MQVRNGGIFVLGPMWRGQVSSIGEPLSWSLLQVLIGEVMKKTRCCKGYMAQHGSLKSSSRHIRCKKRRLSAVIIGALAKT
jgi:hypothetical protein